MILLGKSPDKKPKTSNLVFKVGERVTASFGGEHAAVVAEQQRERTDQLPDWFRLPASAPKILESVLPAQIARHVTKHRIPLSISRTPYQTVRTMIVATP